MTKLALFKDHPLFKVGVKRLQYNLNRHGIDTCSQWAINYRVMGKPFPGPWSFKYHPWLKEMHDARCSRIVGKKAAQVGYTEWALNRAFYELDMLGNSVVYYLPNWKPDAYDFSSARFGAACAESEYLANLFAGKQNVGHKQTGSVSLYVRGAKSRAQMKSIPVALIILDELDEMNLDLIPLALERASGQQEKDFQVLMLSTPTVDGIGIDEQFQTTTQEHFFFPCPSCNRHIELKFPESLEIYSESMDDLSRIEETRLRCYECDATLPHELKPDYLSKAIFVPSTDKYKDRGFHVNQMYSSAVGGVPWRLGLKYLKGLTNAADEEEFWNSALGMAFVAEGARVVDTEIDQCLRTHRNETLPPNNTLQTMGVDVGYHHLHVQIDQWTLVGNPYGSYDINTHAIPRVIYHGKKKDFQELDNLMRDYMIRVCVVDSQPERRSAYEFAQRHSVGRVYLCTYGNIRGDSRNYDQSAPNRNIVANAETSITVDRTSWLDLTLGRFRSQRVWLPAFISSEYRSHMKALVRRYRRDNMGNPVAEYVRGNKDDHYAHAANYAEIALPLAARVGKVQNIERVC